MTQDLGAQEPETELVFQEKPSIFSWLKNIWLQPRATLQKVLAYEKGVWLIPLLLLSGLQIIKNLVEGPVRSAATMAQLQEKMMEQAAQNLEMGMRGGEAVMDAQQAGGITTGPVFTILVPALIALVSIWLVWIIFGSMLHLSLTLAGNRNNATTSLNLMAWASLPFAIRLVVQIIAVLATQKLIAAPGLAGFISTATGAAGGFLSGVLANVDIYFIWQFVLLVIGGMLMGNISRGKAIVSVLVCALIMLALQAIPGAVSQSLSGLTSSPIYFF